MTTSPITIALARCDEAASRGVQAMIAGDPQLTLVATDVPLEQMAATVGAFAPDLAILDLAMLSSPAQLRALHLRFPRTRLIVLVDNITAEEYRLLIGFGATACLSKQLADSDFLHAIHLANRGLHLLPTERGRPE